MTVTQAVSQIVEAIESKLIQDHGSVLKLDDFCIGLARVGSDDQKIVRCPLSQMVKVEFGSPLHCFVIEGKLHPLEEDMLKLFTL